MANDITSHVERKAGSAIEADVPSLTVINPVTGENTVVYLFIAALPFSSTCWNPHEHERDHWLRCHVAMYKWLGGATPRLIPDSLRAGGIDP